MVSLGLKSGTTLAIALKIMRMTFGIGHRIAFQKV
jgi:hypothetical protein